MPRRNTTDGDSSAHDAHGELDAHVAWTQVARGRDASASRTRRKRDRAAGPRAGDERAGGCKRLRESAPLRASPYKSASSQTRLAAEIPRSPSAACSQSGAQAQPLLWRQRQKDPGGKATRYFTKASRRQICATSMATLAQCS
eukprot:4379300-Pleurochrysis_carterae.AAC.1